MSVSILGGVAKGFKVEVPNSRFVRPTSVMLRRRFFDSMQRLEGYIFIDLCSGSGSIGIEALSRGADELLLIESNKSIVRVLKNNCKRLSDKFEVGQYRIFQQDSISFLKKFLFDKNKKYVLFFDPPYEDMNLYRAFFDLIDFIPNQSIIVVEACSQKTCSVEFFEKQFLRAKKIFKQGTSFLCLYNKGEM